MEVQSSQPNILNPEIKNSHERIFDDVPPAETSPKISVVEAALHYQSRGFSVIPLRGDKHPFFKWEEFQRRRATPEEIKKWWQENPKAMIGVITGAISGVVVVDIDDKASNDAIKAMLPKELITPLALPICQTPRGGVHLYFKHPGVPIGNATGFIQGVDFRGDGGYVVAPPSVTGAGKAYSWLPKVRLWMVPLPELPEKLQIAITRPSGLGKVGGNKNNDKGGVGGGSIAVGGEEGVLLPHEVTHEVTASKIPQMTSNDLKLFEEGARNDQLFTVANKLVRGGMGGEDLFQVMRKFNESCSPPLPEKELATICQSALKRGDQRAELENASLASEVRDFIMTSNGAFLTSDVLKAVGVTSRQGRKNVTNELLRAKTKRLIQKVGDKNGCYRRLETEVEEIDIFAQDVRYHPVMLPLGLRELVQIMEKNIIIVAGGSDAGKTAFMLNLARDNMDKKVTYFSSEMGQLELRSRLEYFETDLENWKQVRFLSRSENFADVIDPDGINIIDYLEIHDDFYLVGQLIKDIFDRLNKGLAFIAIQKPEGRETALGGGRSLDKARLYLALDRPNVNSDDPRERDYNKARIIKAKNWRDPLQNPNGMQMYYQLLKGHIFINKINWHRPDGKGKGRRN